MLALPPSLPSPREQRPPPAMTASLAILPQRPPARPKLQLNTQQTRSFGKGSSLRLETLSAVSPTIRNTFTNAYEAPVSAVPALGRPSKPRLSIDSSIPSQAPSAQATALQLDTSIPTSSAPDSASTLSSGCTSASSSDSATVKVPYKLSHNLPSILSNSPAQSLRPRKMAPFRPFFPATKRVSFRTPLEEEITTSTYTLAHSDIEPSRSSTLSSDSSSTSTSSTSLSIASTDSTEFRSESESLANSPSTISLSSSTSEASSSPSPPASSSSDQSSSPAFSFSSSPAQNRGPRTGEKRDSSSSESDSEDSCPETPVAGRRKRRREWVWTLGPIGKHSSSSEQTTSDDSS